MDVYGKHPSEKIGEYFRQSVWGWHPLWDFCCTVRPDLTDKVKHGHTNDGDGLNEKDSIDLANTITQWLDEGLVDQYITEYQKAVDNIPLEMCVHCDGTGTRHDGKKIGRDTDDFQCNACHGHGKRESFMTWYRITKDSVKEFRDFLQCCGGFEIY